MHLTYELPKLEYEFNELEPYISREMMQIHYEKHHASYVKKLNTVLEGHKELMEKFSPEGLLRNLDKVPKEIKQKIINFCGGHVNHSFFWQILGKNKEPDETLDVVKAIEKKFGSLESFETLFSGQANAFFGSGWTWLVLDNKTNNLEIYSTLNQESPISRGKTPLLCIDLWEHAYYLQYQYRRADYVEAFFRIINWRKVNEYYVGAINNS